MTTPEFDARKASSVQGTASVVSVKKHKTAKTSSPADIYQNTSEDDLLKSISELGKDLASGLDALKGENLLVALGGGRYRASNVDIQKWAEKCGKGVKFNPRSVRRTLHTDTFDFHNAGE
ncbi:hypothetical protein ONE63_011122 [Megalurothrips usitatus]|uniref:Uncharacterized protein n=1 Tax=Megalurothrips usitatus TaxID=439358 RepID=A0AAV7XF29_9NEOP|nr:hypothetical protein ONE63_011122 [Megalurothrips usitatus]